ncbi:MAG: hypothetical protein ACI4XI_05995 [Ruminococcus sp.]
MRKIELKKRLSELEQANLDKTSEIAILRKEKRYLQNKNNDLKNQVMKLSLLKNDKRCEGLEAENKRLFEAFEIIKEKNEKLFNEINDLIDEIEKLENKILNLKTDKEGLIEYAKKLRYMHSCAEDEIKRLNEICNMLNNNIEAQNVTAAQNDIEFYKLVEQNAFLAGEVKAYQAAMPKAEKVISEE